MARIFVPSELDRLVGKTVSVDSLDDFYPKALLVAVFRSGKFEIVTEEGATIVCNLDDAKVFA